MGMKVAAFALYLTSLVVADFTNDDQVLSQVFQEQQIIAQTGIESTLMKQETCNPECKNGGICSGGNCYCRSPYGGKVCDTSKSILPLY